LTPSPGIEPGPHWWEVSALATTPSLFPIVLFASFPYFFHIFFSLLYKKPLQRKETEVLTRSSYDNNCITALKIADFLHTGWFSYALYFFFGGELFCIFISSLASSVAFCSKLKTKEADFSSLFHENQ